ncbi:MAG: MBL fold metallo-hydrolase [candidate division Zixibacteria bacterium]|jgi:L-ascorbate metabolism protein UlaG (beta-lactamase superfamily)|nr:MBL fold metallo-hydrolase [candidate division Zixibacteria bacterium]
MVYRLLILLVSSQILGCSSENEQPKLAVTYIANCGYLIETEHKAVIIDGFLAPLERDYYFKPTDSVANLMRTAQPPFDRIDLALFTHVHDDHFNADVTAQHLFNNPRANVVGPPQIDSAMSLTEQYREIRDRVHVVAAPGDSVETLYLNGITVEVFPSKHSSYVDEDTVTGEKFDRHAGIGHLEYFVTMDGRTLYHSGDAGLMDFERYQSFGFGDTTVDMAFVDWWDERPQITFTQKLIHDVIRPDRIFMIHMSPSRPPQGCPDTQTFVAPEVYLPESLMQRWDFSGP